MIIKFDRTRIASINNSCSSNSKKSVTMGEALSSKSASIPEKETFKYVFENAKKGNEMAAVLLDEWHRDCKPRNDEEKQVLNLIDKAVNKIFK